MIVEELIQLKDVKPDGKMNEEKFEKRQELAELLNKTLIESIKPKHVKRDLNSSLAMYKKQIIKLNQLNDEAIYKLKQEWNSNE